MFGRKWDGREEDRGMDANDQINGKTIAGIERNNTYEWMNYSKRRRYYG